MQYNLSKALAAAVIIPLALGCKREPIPQYATAPATPGTPIASKVQQWLKQQPLGISAQGRSGTANTFPKHTIQWEQARYTQRTATHFVPMTLWQEGQRHPYLKAGLVATEDAQGQINGGHYMVALPDRKKMGQAAAKYYNLARLYTPDPKEQPTDYSGAVLYYNTAGALTASRVYDNGRPRAGATATLVGKPMPKNTPNSRPLTNCVEEQCIDWFWQTFVDGVLIDEEYLFTTCCDNDNGGGPLVDNEGACSPDCQEAGAFINMIHGTSERNFTTISTAPLPSPLNEPEKIREAKIVKVDFYKLNFFGGFYARFSAYYNGVRYKNNASDANWKWESLTFSPPSSPDGYHTEGDVPPCHSVAASYNAMPVMFTTDRRQANVGYSYNVKAYFTCPISLEIHNYSNSWPTWWYDANW